MTARDQDRLDRAVLVDGGAPVAERRAVTVSVAVHRDALVPVSPAEIGGGIAGVQPGERGALAGGALAHHLREPMRPDPVAHGPPSWGASKMLGR